MKKIVSIFKNGRVMVLIAIMIVLTITCPGMFLTGSNFSSILLSVSLYGIMTAGAIYCCLTSGPDLSVGGMAALSSVISVRIIIANHYTVQGVVLGFLAAIAVSAVIGLIHGLIIYYFNAQSFLITLATKYIMFGVAQIVTQNKIIACTSSDAFNFVGSGRFLGLAMPVYVFFLVAIILTVVLTKTRYGREIYAVGGNKKASQICGIKPSRIVISTFVISSVCAAVTGVLLAAFNQQASPAAGDGYEGEVLLCIVLGGIAIGSGIGKMSGALYGVFLLSILNNGMRLLGVPTMYQTLLKGVLIILAVAVDVYILYRSSGLLKKRAAKALKTDT